MKKMSSLKTSVTLSSENMGDANEEDYTAWVQFVCDHIDEACGFEVEVDSHRFGEVGEAVFSPHEDKRQVVAEVLQDLWTQWCED